MPPPLLPARCESCGLSFQPKSLGVLIDNAVDVTIGESTYACPSCGGRARLLQGTFNVSGGAIEMISGPQWSWDLVDELRLALRRAVDSGPAGDPLQMVAQVSPEVADAVEQVTAGWSADRVIALLSALYAILATDYRTLTDNVGVVGAVLQEFFRYVAENGRLPGA